MTAWMLHIKWKVESVTIQTWTIFLCQISKPNFVFYAFTDITNGLFWLISFLSILFFVCVFITICIPIYKIHHSKINVWNILSVGKQILHVFIAFIIKYPCLINVVDYSNYESQLYIFEHISSYQKGRKQCIFNRWNAWRYMFKR